MRGGITYPSLFLGLVLGLVLCLVLYLTLVPTPIYSQKEVTSKIYRYQQKEVFRRQSGAHEVKPISHPPTTRAPITRKELIDISPTADKIRHRRYMADSHTGLRFYRFRSCVDCHPTQAFNLHRVRAKVFCRQCHGEEPIPGTRYYYSGLHPIRRYALVCAKCHKGASASFAAYVVHEPSPALKTTQKDFPLLFYVFWAMVVLAFGTFAAFIPHTILWGLRELWPGKNDTPKKTFTRVEQIQRFTAAQRGFHLVLILTFVTQAGTGLARMYAGTNFGNLLSSFFGGYTTALFIHKGVGIFMLAAFVFHLVYLIERIDLKNFPHSLISPDSILPRFGDIGQAAQHIAWLVGLKKCPKFDRWAYWEKFDYWAVFWGINILGITGLILFHPVFSSRFMPGWTLNVLLWIHRIEAVLAMGHVFIIHFFIGHLRRHHFPMDLTMFEGNTDVAKLSQERPAWIKRLKLNSTLPGLTTKKTSLTRQYFYYFFGFAVMAICLFLLINGLLNARELIRILLNT